MRASIITLSAGLLGAAGVAGAAFAAHGGDGRLAAIAAAICLVHAPALLAVGLANGTTRLLTMAAGAGTVGVVLFSGDLFAQAVLGVEWPVPAAPIGGTTLVLGWLAAAAAGFRLNRS